MQTEIIDYLAARVAAVLPPAKRIVLGARAVTFVAKDAPLLEVYPTRNSQITRLTTDGTSQVSDSIRVGYYQAEVTHLTSGELSDVTVREVSQKLDALLPTMLGLFDPEPAELAGVEIQVVSSSRHVKPGGMYGLELELLVGYIVAPVTP